MSDGPAASHSASTFSSKLVKGGGLKLRHIGAIIACACAIISCAWPTMRMV